MRRAGLLLALACLAHSAPAHADLATAKQHFADGVKRYEKGDFEGARRLFAEADREHHTPAIVYNLGLAEERLGRLHDAVASYERYLAEAGEDGEFAQAAAVAVAQIKARAGRLQIASEPPGLRLFVNGLPVRDRSPTLVLVPPGHHLVVAESEGYRQTADVDVDAGATQRVEFKRPVGAATPEKHEPGPAELHGFVAGASFQLVPYAFLPRRQQNEEGAGGVFVGLSAEAGYAFTSAAVIALRAYGSIGSECKGFFDSHIASAGPGISLRLRESFWVGLGLYGGNGSTCRAGQQPFSTDIVFSPVLDVAYAVTSRSYGQWLVSLGVGYYFATPSNDNRLLYAPVGFGPRFF